MGTLTRFPGQTVLALQQNFVRAFLRHERKFDRETWRFIVLSWVGCIGMPAYYLIWTYWFPQPYDNLLLRLVGMALCLPAPWANDLFKGRWRDAYFAFAVTYVLPFQFTFLYLMNAGSLVWAQSLLISLIVLFHFPFRCALFSLAAGVAAACALFAVLGDPAFLLRREVLEHLPIYAFTIVVISLAKEGRRVLANEKLAGMAQALATVSHELRTPLVSVDANVRGINRRIASGRDPSAADWHALAEAMGRIQHEVRHMNHMVDLFLLSASAVRQQLEADEQVSMQSVVEAVIRRYPFATQSQRDAVRVDVRADFTFAGRHELSVVILLNLLRNSLKALQRAGKGRIRIIIDGNHARPRLLFIDTGCGIPAARLPLIFQRFYSYPANSGSGIGLALCKEIMDAWHARIICKSREQAYTMFVLEFPRPRPAPAPRVFPHQEPLS
ncbi:HAMP domain-containing histidine kinase [Massilia sp. PAMC28688]|uniref:sensor histidine kinase n=1 Tax=Massilia sp. PAMC28688 TaxID=2861283 RepID=UPI001C6268B0|nr:HAMP domain-containing sensor histidine kinase [Massilia sp. PAMC28688]QYF91956.1 HAMP domain-containing histidine kinase [Massilia sp. PAMC28688]